MTLDAPVRRRIRFLATSMSNRQAQVKILALVHTLLNKAMSDTSGSRRIASLLVDGI